MTLDFALLAFTAGLILITFLLTLAKNRRKNSPPGPIAWPLIGNIFEIGTKSFLSFEKMRRKYGDVFQIHVGSYPVVVVCGKAINQCLNKDSVTFSKRPDLFLSRNVLDGKSLAFSSISIETHHRYKKIGISELRHVVNTNTDKEKRRYTDLENIMFQEAEWLGKKMVEVSEQEVGDLEKDILTDIIAHATCNIASYFVFGKRSQFRDKRAKAMLKLFKDADKTSAIFFEFFPFLEKILREKFRKTVSELKEIKIFLQNELADFKSTEDKAENNNGVKRGTCLLGRTMELWKKQENEKYEEDYLMNLNSDFFGAAGDTTRASIQWLIMYAATYQDEQTKLRDVINSFRKQYNRYPTFSERGECSYLMAFFVEVLRHSSILPFAPTHCTVSDTQLFGYSIPKNTITLISFWSLNKSEEVWENPEIFRPGRFMTESGKFNGKLAEKVAAFGDGRRRCPGEIVGKMEAFIFLNVLMHNYKFERTRKNKNSLPESVLKALSVRPKVMDIKTTKLTNTNGSYRNLATDQTQII